MQTHTVLTESTMVSRILEILREKGWKAQSHLNFLDDGKETYDSSDFESSILWLDKTTPIGTILNQHKEELPLLSRPDALKCLLNTLNKGVNIREKSGLVILMKIGNDLSRKLILQITKDNCYLIEGGLEDWGAEIEKNWGLLLKKK